MLFKKKKAEFTKTECLAISIAQWCILQLIPKKFTNQNVFFSQITISTVPISKLGNDFKITKGKIYKAIQLEFYFTTLEEWLPKSINELRPVRPYVNSEILFVKETVCSLTWKPSAFRVELNRYPNLYNFQSFEYNIKKIIETKSNYLQLERDNKFDTFFEKFSQNAP